MIRSKTVFLLSNAFCLLFLSEMKNKNHEKHFKDETKKVSISKMIYKEIWSFLKQSELIKP